MKILYMHVGIPKTGTSAIQHFLFDNQTVLEEKGFSYQKQPYSYRGVGGCRNAHFLIGKVYDEEGKEDKEKKEQVWADGLASILQQFEKCDNVIISDESLWLNFGRQNNTVLSRLKAWADENSIVIKLIVYLRRQDEFVSSLWRQQVKEGVKFCTFEDYCKTKEVLLRERYDENLGRIAEVIGKENIFVRRFDRSCFPDGSIQGDFLSLLGLELTDEYSMQHEIMNVSTNNDYTEILRILNVLSDEAGQIQNKENRYFADIALRLSKAEGENSTLFDESRMRAFMDAYLEGNRNVAKEYLDEDGELFDITYSQLPVWSKESEHYREAVIKYFGQALLDIRGREEAQKEREKKLAEKEKELWKELHTLKTQLAEQKKAQDGQIAKYNAELTRLNSQVKRLNGQVENINRYRIFYRFGRYVKHIVKKLLSFFH